MTSEYGAASQLEKIDMLDFADIIVLNKFEKRGARRCPARRAQAVAAQSSRARAVADEEVPVFPTIASRFNDPGVNHLFAELCKVLGTGQQRASAGLEARDRRADEVRLPRSADPGNAHSLPRRDLCQRTASER